ncbi:MAG: hypothetical protein RI971_745 [Chloroflexota bacterium]
MARNVAIFVDVANVFYAAKAAGVDIDYVTLLKTLTANRDLVRAYAYTGLDPDNENQKAFHNFLARNNYKVVSKDVRKYGDGRFKANLDIELVVDLVRLAPKLDIAVVISGDGDFAPAIRAVQDMGVRVEVVSFRANTSSDLVEVADQFIEITNIAKVEAGARSGRRVAAEGEEDLSMTEVPDKQSEAPARPRRGGAAPERERGRGGRGGRTATPRTGAPARRSSAIRVGDTLIDADSIETLTLDDLGPDDLAAGAEPSPHNHEGVGSFGEGGTRRRRRRGGRGRRGRGGVSGDSLDGIETMTLDDVDDGAPGGVPEYLATERRGTTGRGPVRAARQQLGSGPSRIADEVTRSHKDDEVRSNTNFDDSDDGISDVSPEVAALLKSQLQATGRSASESAAFSGNEAPVSGKGRARGGRPAPKSAAKPAAKSAAKPAGRGTAKPTAKVALVKKSTARPKAKGSKGA